MCSSDLLGFEPAWLQACLRHFPLVGACVGAWAAAIFWFALLLWPPLVASTVSLVATVWLTGAFHEDGLADSYDGLYGGFQKERILEIMKDSRIGTYGSVALFSALFLKFQALVAIENIALALLVGHSLSRFGALCYIPLMPYVREKEQSKVKPVVKNMDRRGMALAALAGFIPLIVLPPIQSIAVLFIVLI